jgi:hypothetical protein
VPRAIRSIGCLAESSDGAAKFGHRLAGSGRIRPLTVSQLASRLGAPPATTRIEQHSPGSPSDQRSKFRCPTRIAFGCEAAAALQHHTDPAKGRCGSRASVTMPAGPRTVCPQLQTRRCRAANWRRVPGGDQNYEKIAARKRTRHSRLDYAWVAPFCRLAIRFSQGAKWKALISKYIEVIPPSGEECSAVEQRISGWPPPRTPVSSAMIAKVGAAARYSQSDKERAAGYLLSECIAPAAHPAGWVLFKSFPLRHCVNDSTRSRVC